jgi:hypothetical protein
MSALGHERTFGKVRLISALPPKADINQNAHNVRFVPTTDSCNAAKLRSLDYLIDLHLHR